MATIKQTIFMLVGVEGHYRAGQKWLSSYDEHTMDHNKGQVMCVGETEIELEFPDVDTRQMQIDALEDAVQVERAQSQSRVNLLLDRISKLKCLTHEVEV